jgi:hypothetical protein
MTDEEIEKLGTERIHLDGLKIDPAAIAVVPEALARAHHFMPIALHGVSLTIAVSHSDVDFVDRLAFDLKLEVTILASNKDEVDRCLQRHYQ